MATNIPVSPTWLSRFEEWLDTAFHDCFDSGWKSEIKVEEGIVCAWRERDGARVCVDLHPGLSVVIPLYAAQRVSRNLRDAAVKAGFLEPA